MDEEERKSLTADSIYKFTCASCGHPWEVCRPSGTDGLPVKDSSTKAESCPHCGNIAGHSCIQLRAATAADKRPRTPMDALFATLDDMTAMFKDPKRREALSACFVDGKLVDRDRFRELVVETVQERIPDFKPSEWAESVEQVLLTQAARGESPDGGEAVDKD